jgi:N6-L-threonylcarbamoyladenine synthase
MPGFVNARLCCKIIGMSDLILGIETSCDETAAAVIEGGRKALSNVVASQVDIHKEYGGVVPEIASRKHVELILAVVKKALTSAGKDTDELEGIAVTNGPGLLGSLMVGLSTAKAFAYGLGIPLIGVNHLEAHLSAVHLEHDVEFPFVGLVVSGGHTSLYLVKDYAEFELLGKTRDDAAGEVLDKAAKLLGLGYPGGVEIDRIAKEGDPDAIRFPRPFKSSASFDFSFSGLKTSIVYYIRKHPAPDSERLKDVCAGYQEAIAETLTDKTLLAAMEYGVKSAVISGGVACNSRLRALARERFDKEGITLHIPSPVYCTDNAAMIGALGAMRLRLGESSELNLNPYSTSRPRYVRGKGTIKST